MRENYTAILVQGEEWSGTCVSEPYEAPWAAEAVVFLRLLDGTTAPAGLRARVQISPDGMHWVDEGTEVAIPTGPEVTFARVSHFGQFLRLAADLPAGTRFTLLATLNLKS